MKGIRLRHLEEKSGLKKTKLYQLISEGRLPKPRKVGYSSIWIEAEVDKALEKLFNQQGRRSA